jgi:serine/threonine protein kinase/WD40 repeat protein
MTERSIFLAALDIDDPQKRSAYLDCACAADPTLRTQVEQLLKAHQAPGSFMDRPAGGLVATIDEPITDRPGTVIGPYKLLEQIGEGGFGVVFMAEQTQPVRRKVALKVLKPGMDTRQVVARFEAERQALALMDHLNIARVFDGGETALGRPYFVMELVRGIPITEFCDQNHLPIRQRLELFVSICQAVQHAHQRGIIHRDLKPSNMLVTLHDGVPVPKVIDFGIAKALGQQLTDKTLFTNFAVMIGTPLYMSPEQAELSGLDIDTRSDIYALGVLLYELLTGTTPFDAERLRTAAYDEVRRIIREEEPPRPSTRLSTLGQATATVSANRQTDPKRLRQLFRGELDWIVMKALEKDRNRRYETASAFAADVQRYLHDEPVQACPPSAWYRFRKFVQRYKGRLAIAGLFLLLITTLAVVSTIGALWLGKALNDSETNLRAAEKANVEGNAKLWDSLLSQARAGRMSRRVGQRYGSLEAIKKAVALPVPDGRSLDELRNEAIACLALPDFRPIKIWDLWPAGTNSVCFNGDLERYARADLQKKISVRRVADDVEMASLTASDGPHQAWISPDGRFVTAWSDALRLQCWKLAGPTPELAFDEADVTTYDFSPDSRQCAVTRAEGHLDLLDRATGKCVQRIEQATAPNRAHEVHLAFHPDQAKVAVAGPRGVSVVDLQAGRVVLKLPDERAAYHVCWHPNGRTLAVVNFGSTDMHLWDVLSNKKTLSLGGHKNAGIRLCFSPRGDALLSQDWNGTVHWWDPYSGQQLLTTPGAWYGRGLGTDGRRLAGEFGGGESGIWEIALPREYRTLVRDPVHGKGIYYHPTVSSDGQLLAVGMQDGVALWDLEAGTAVAFLPLGQTMHVLFEPSGSLLTNTPLGLLRWKVRPERGGQWLVGPPERLGKLNHLGAIAQSRDGRVLAHANFDGALLFDPDRPGQPIHLRPHEDARYVTVSPDGCWVATGSHSGTAVKVWAADTGKPVRTLLPDRSISGVCFSPDGKWLANGGGGSCRLWSTATWEEKPGPKIGTALPAFTPDGKLMAVELARGLLALVEVESGRELARLEDPNQDGATHMVFSPDGSRLVAVNLSDSGTVHVWDLRAIREQLKELGLDWDAPPLPPADPGSKAGAPSKVEVDLDGLAH